MRELSLGTLPTLAETLAPEHVALLEAQGVTVPLARHARIYHQGDPARHVWFLRSGRVSAVLSGAGGQETVLRLHLPASLLGLSALGSDPVREADAVVTEDAVLLRLSVAKFETLMAEHSGLARQVVGLLVDRLRDYHHRVAEFAALPVRQRVARALVALAAASDATAIRTTHEEIARLTQARRPTVSAALGELTAAGCIGRQGRAIAILDRAALAREAAA